ncbi:uncharacterized protein LOC133502448 [Syngnathoides biaculeatus]|uniref:uncharacterized protein LOC133502448 n=1 Tax=Syngnathoides biaculeatus TaxID=300417 RepID=UPI002ADD6B4E|nr:uncharacterized protein LOC133502448 [Syngnathoides biaculeatus]
MAPARIQQASPKQRRATSWQAAPRSTRGDAAEFTARRGKKKFTDANPVVGILPTGQTECSTPQMEFTALCTFLISLASSGLSREGNEGSGSCVATLRAGAACGPGRAGCPYVLSLPPMTVHLPKQLGDLEKLLKDLQTLKDDVDQLREMCGDGGVRPDIRYDVEGHSQTRDLDARDRPGKTAAGSVCALETGGKEAAAKEAKGENQQAKRDSGGKETGNHRERQVRPDDKSAEEKKTQIKMLQNHGRQDQGKICEEKKKEMEKGRKAGKIHEKPKQIASRGLQDKSGSNQKDGEVDGETERGKQAEDVQSDGDGGSAPRRATQTTDFVSISWAPALTYSSTQSPQLADLDQAESITSSLPSPPFSKSTSQSFPVISPERTQTTTTESSPESSLSDLTSYPSSSPGGIIPWNDLHTTLSPEAAEPRRWTSVDAGLKGPRGLKAESEAKREPGTNRDANEPKDPERDNKPNVQTEQKMSHLKNKAEMKLKPGNETKRLQIQKDDNWGTDPHLKIQKPKHGQDKTTHQQQVASDQQARPAANEEPESSQKPMSNKNSKPNKRPVRPFKTSKIDQKKKNDKKVKTDTKQKVDQNKEKQHFTQELQTDSEKTQKPTESLHSNSSGNSESHNTFTANPGQRLTSSRKIPNINTKPKTGQLPKPNQKQPKPARDQNTKANENPKASQVLPDTDHQSVSHQNPGENSNKGSEAWAPSRPPTGKTLEPGATPAEPKQNTTINQPHHFSQTKGSFYNAHLPPAPSPVPRTTDVTHSRVDTEFQASTMKTFTPMTSENQTVGPNSGVVSDLTPQTTNHPPLDPRSTRPIRVYSVIPSTNPAPTEPNLHARDETAPPQKTIRPLSSGAQTTSSYDFGSTTTTDAEARPAAKSTTSSARELRVKIKQVAAAFFNGSQVGPSRRPPVGRRPEGLPEANDGESRQPGGRLKLRPSERAVSVVKRDCSDHLITGRVMKSGIYRVTPDPHTGGSFLVLCDMEVQGGGWTLLQLRQDGGVGFNRTWVEYRSGFGELLNGGEFWLGNQNMHLLTRDRDMTLRVELEDFSGVAGYAEYEHFRVASERMRYRLTVGGYSGTAGNALRFGSSYDHNNRAFTTPDRDNDRYPSGNCGAYYSSGWWFDACMAANLNGRYYVGKYKGVRDGIYWGAWHNISTEFYPTNERQSFKTVRMMIRPKGLFS